MLIKDAVFCVIDCETTGLDPATDRVVEIAAVACSTTEVLGMWATLVDGRPVTPDNSAIHGLVNEDLIGAPDWKTGYEGLERFCRYFDQRGEITVPTAHNAAFDQGFVEPDGQPWLCTKRLAQHLYPDATGYSNQTLRYWFPQLDLAPGHYVETFGIAAHRALGDALVTARNLRFILKAPSLGVHGLFVGLNTVEELIAFAQSPITITKWPFGKHKGDPIAAAPYSYCQWMLRQEDCDPDIRFTLEAHLKSESVRK